jgi:hypothetical protein
MEYTHADNSKGIIGIEVKYTEKEYQLKRGSKEEYDINDENGLYHLVTKKSGLYKPNSIEKLKTDIFRQIWRNHLLAESIRLVDSAKCQYATSIIFYPKDNGHFTEANKEYCEMLVKNDNKFISVTYEDFLGLCEKYCPNDDFKNWIEYVNSRYIIKTLSKTIKEIGRKDGSKERLDSIKRGQQELKGWTSAQIAEHFLLDKIRNDKIWSEYYHNQ